MKKHDKQIVFTFIRYLTLLILALFNLKIIYLIATPLTIYPVFFALKLFYSPVSLIGSTIIFGNTAISIISACVAGSAYYLLLLLNISIPMKPKLRLKSLSFMILIFLILNVLRTIIFSLLFASGFEYFDITHRFVWYFGSTILIIGIWFFSVFLFNIKEIPVYSDIKTLIRFSRKRN